MQPTVAGTSAGVGRLRAVAVVLPGAALLQLLGQVLLRWPGGAPGSVGWDVAHVVLVLGALTLLAALLLLAVVTGPGLGTWLGAALVAVGQASTLAVLAVDLDVVSARVEVIEALDAWDFLAVVGSVVLLLELRRRRGAEPGTDIALVALAVPSTDGLVVVAAVAVVVGFAVLAHSVATCRGRGPAWLAVVAVVAYAVAAMVSWQRAGLAVVVLAWTAQLVQARISRAGRSG